MTPDFYLIQYTARNARVCDGQPKTVETREQVIAALGGFKDHEIFAVTHIYSNIADDVTDEFRKPLTAQDHADNRADAWLEHLRDEAMA